MKSKTFLRISFCVLACLTGLSFSTSFFVASNDRICSGLGDGDPTPLPPNPPPPPPPGMNFGVNLI